MFQTFRLAGLASNTYCVKGTECNETDGNDPAKIREGRFVVFLQCGILKIFLKFPHCDDVCDPNLNSHFKMDRLF